MHTARKTVITIAALAALAGACGTTADEAPAPQANPAPIEADAPVAETPAAPEAPAPEAPGAITTTTEAPAEVETDTPGSSVEAPTTESVEVDTETEAPEDGVYYSSSSEEFRNLETDGWAGSGCAPGTPDALPDGIWYVDVHEVTDSGLVVDLLCWTWDSERALEINGGDPNTHAWVNDNPRLRSIPAASDDIPVSTYRFDQEFEAFETNLGSWPTVGYGFENGEPTYIISVVIYVNDGEITEIDEFYLP